MRNLRLLVGTLVGAMALVAGCSPAASPALTTQPTTAATSTLAAAAKADAAAVQRVVAGALGLAIPAGWQQRQGSLNPGGNEPFLYAGPEDLPSDCQTTAQGMTCASWPIMQLPPDGIVVAVRFYGMPGFKPPAGGDPITVAGLAGRRISGAPDGACREIGGAQLVEVWLPTFAGANGIYSIDACTSGQGVASADAFSAILASVTLGGLL